MVSRVVTLIQAYGAYLERRQGEDERWQDMTPVELAGYFLFCYGMACGSDWLYESNEAAGPSEGWEGFDGSEKQKQAEATIDAALEDE